jgi:hypothetical protein
MTGRIAPLARPEPLYVAPTPRCTDCGAPATYEVLPRTGRGSRFTCEQGVRALDSEHRRRLTLADFA